MAAETLKALSVYPNVDAIARAILKSWPEHEKYLRAAFEHLGAEEMLRIDYVGGLILASAGDAIDDYAADYRWMCDRLFDERLYFARNKKYRRSTPEQANQAVYANAAFMSRYLHGILLSQVCWRNHAAAMDLYRTRFLPGNRFGYDHLEIGPGHGLFLAIAAQDTRSRSLNGWDVSPSSLEMTTKALDRMGVAREVTLTIRDVVQAPAPDLQFDSIVCSEVLEHTAEPSQVLRNLYGSLRTEGRLFLNVPINSPAPDHILLWRRAAEVAEMIADHRFTIDEFIELPPTGKTLDQARKYDLDISCVAIVRKS